MDKEKRELVDHPAHYNRGNIEAIEVIEDWKLYFSVGSAVKYIARLGAKDLEMQELEKTKWYLKRVVSNKIGAEVSTGGKYSVDEVIKDWGLNKLLGMVLRFIYLQEYNSAILALDMEIERRKKDD